MVQVCAILKEMPNRLEPYDRVFHALADPSRRSMVERLVYGPASVSQLAEPLAMSLAAVVQHLGVLEEAGIVVSAKVGRVRTCRLEPNGLRRVEDWLVAQRTEWERRLDRLGEVLATQDGSERLDQIPALGRGDPPGRQNASSQRRRRGI
jgi:DNA-binding transcriptional ArsR family regulator